MLPPLLLQRSARVFSRFLWRHVGLLAALLAATWDRVALLQWWKAFPGGDTYNFILIAQEMLRGGYPIAEKRLPVYPLLLLLARPFADWETAAIAVALGMSLTALVLLYAIGRTIGISKTALAVGLLAFEAATPFLFQSIRGYADTTFVALTLGTLLVFLRAHTWRGLAGAGLLAGLAALTRPEGVVLVALVPLLAALNPRGYASSQPLGLAALVAAVAPLILFAALSVSVGRPLLPAEYLKDAEVSEFGASSPQILARNVWALWQSLGADRLWAVPGGLLQSIADAPGRLLPRLWSFLTNPKELPGVLAGVGLVWLLATRRRAPFLPVLLAFLALSVPIAWWGVRQRFLVVLSPLPFLLLAAGAQAVLTWIRRWPAVQGAPSYPYARAGDAEEGTPPRGQTARGPSEGAGARAPAIQNFWGIAADRRGWEEPPRQDPRPANRAIKWAARKAGPLAAPAGAAALLLLSFFSWRTNNALEQREVIAKNQGQGYAYYQAIQTARRLPGRIAFDHRSSIALALFGEPDRGRGVFADTHLNAPDAAEQWAAIERWEVRYLVVRQDEADAFPVLTDPAFRDRFSVVERFEYPQTRGGPDRATTYAVR